MISGSSHMCGDEPILAFRREDRRAVVTKVIAKLYRSKGYSPPLFPPERTQITYSRLLTYCHRVITRLHVALGVAMSAS